VTLRPVPATPLSELSVDEAMREGNQAIRDMRDAHRLMLTSMDIPLIWDDTPGIQLHEVHLITDRCRQLAAAADQLRDAANRLDTITRDVNRRCR
jgi:hypothetical protein